MLQLCDAHLNHKVFLVDTSDCPCQLEHVALTLRTDLVPVQCDAFVGPERSFKKLSGGTPQVGIDFFGSFSFIHRVAQERRRIWRRALQPRLASVVHTVPRHNKWIN